MPKDCYVNFIITQRNICTRAPIIEVVSINGFDSVLSVEVIFLYDYYLRSVQFQFSCRDNFVHRWGHEFC